MTLPAIVLWCVMGIKPAEIDEGLRNKQLKKNQPEAGF